MGVGRSGHLHARALEALPRDLGAPVEIPLAFEADEAGTYTLVWDLAEMPEDWAVSLRDNRTGSTLDLRQSAQYVIHTRSEDSRRLTLTVAPGAASRTEPEGDVFALSAPAPNPATDEARAWVRVGSVQPITAVLYDALGRRVATVFEGEATPSAPVLLQVRASGLAAGVYMLRVEGDDHAASHRITVVR